MASTALNAVNELKEQMGKSIIGQEKIIDRIVMVLLAEGNLLLEGLPGLAKTRAITSLSKNLDAGLSRIQFTPRPAAFRYYGHRGVPTRIRGKVHLPVRPGF